MGYTTLDIVVIAVIGVVFGILNSPMGTIYQAFQAAFGPIGSNIWGVFDISQVLAMFIVRKPGAAFINMMINGLVQMLSGNPAGAITLGWGFTQGLGTEIVFAAFGYRRFDWIACFLGGAIANWLANIWTYYVYGFLTVGIGTIVISYIVGFFTYGIASGLVAYAIGKALQRSGALKSFRSGQEPDIIPREPSRA
jgi:energy-coupling factor transport system substrate-specific component